MKNIYLNNFIKDVKKSWLVFFEKEFKEDYFISLDSFIKNEYESKIIFPSKENIFRAFSFFEVNDTKLVMLGQDPYQTEGMADGLSFSTKLDVKPKSLANIFKELKKDFSIDRNKYDLSDIASQGVLLLNTILTVEKNKSLSHANKGWEIFTNNLLTFLSNENKDVIYLLMGNNAIAKESLINHFYKIIKTSHPSPFSYRLNFENKGVFKKINNSLIEKNKKQIIW